MRKSLLLFVIILGCYSVSLFGQNIVHDGEYNFLKQQHGEKWAQEDKSIDKKLAEIRKKNDGKRPNILYILIDDISFGQMGNRAMNYVTGIKTPEINKLATEGLSLMRMYTEPSCTPTRAAFLSGQHPVRLGIKETKVALVGEGLSDETVTIAEVLSKAGYNTAHIGKWHQGDIEEAYPHNQGFDFAAFPVHQQVQLSLMSKEGAQSNNLLGWHHKTQSGEFALDQNFKPRALVTGLEGRKGETAIEIDLEPGEEWTQDHYIKMNERYQRQTLEQLNELSKKDEPFFLQYWPLWPLNFVHDGEQNISANGGFHADKLEVLDGWIGDIMDEIEKLGVAENTIVVFMADNGFMYQFEGKSGLNQLIYRGGKTDFTEGGVRVDAFVQWPGVIEANSAAGDLLHVSDLYTTFARIADATKYIPTDRVIDGIDQTALLLNGEHHGRRDYVYIYQNEVLRAVVKQEFKMHLPAPGMPAAVAGTYNLFRDPREEFPQVGIALWSGASFQDMVKRHLMTIEKYPHKKMGHDRPYEGIENLRPETIEVVDLFESWH